MVNLYVQIMLATVCNAGRPPNIPSIVLTGYIAVQCVTIQCVTCIMYFALDVEKLSARNIDGLDLDIETNSFVNSADKYAVHVTLSRAI